MDAVGLSADQTQRLKAWLVQKGWKLGDAPNAGFMALREPDLRGAGLSAVSRISVQDKLQEAVGELL